MFQSIKELVTVLCVCVPVFYFGRHFAELYMSAEHFARRRNVWYTITCAVFLTPNFWMFALIAAVVLRTAAKKDPNPTALYLFALHASPPVTAPVPHLFGIDIAFLQSWVILMPAALQLLKTAPDSRDRSLKVLDLSLASFGILTSILYLRLQDPSGVLYETTFTDTLRRAFGFFSRIFLPYYVISRAKESTTVVEAMAAFCFSCALMASTAIIESLRHWLLYIEVPSFWGLGGPSAYIMRGDSLRAMASSGHPLALGYLLAIAFGFWLFLQKSIASHRRRMAVSLFYWLGLFAAYSRGPWIGAVAIYFLFAFFGPNGIRNLIQSAALSIGSIAAISLSPYSERIIQVMPFLGGTVDKGNVEYRQRLFDRSWQIIEQSPLFGDQEALLKMQDLRQGEGIIDVINAYVQILLDNGFVGLSLFLAFILVAVYRSLRVSRQLAASDPAASQLGACLVACTVGTLIMIESGGCDQIMVSILVGLMGAYVCQRLPQNSSASVRLVL